MAAKATLAKMKQVLREVEATGAATTLDLTATMVARFIAARPPDQSAWTTHSLLAALRAICTYAEMRGYVLGNPFRLRKLSRWVRLTPMAGKRHFERAEIRRVLDLMTKDVEERKGWKQWRSRRILAVTSLVAYTGIRKMEALRMQVGDLDLPNRAIWIRPHGKSLKTAASEAKIPSPNALVPYLESWLEHRLDCPVGFELPRECPWLIPTVDRRSPWVSGQPGGKALDRLKAVALKAGVADMTFLALRHSWATHAEYFGLGPAEISRVLRHTTTRTAEEHYRHFSGPNLLERTAGFDF
jgi:integrase